MTPTISIMWGVIIAAVAITWALIVKGQSRQNVANGMIVQLLNKTTPLLSKLVSDNVELDALRCVNPICKRRNTPDNVIKYMIIAAGKSAFIEEHRATKCVSCHLRPDCNGPVAKDAICPGYTPPPPSEEEPVNYCGDCETATTCKRCNDLRQEACDDFELASHH